MMRTSNPALNADTFKDVSGAGEAGAAMTLGGVVIKTAALLLLLLLAAGFTWSRSLSAEPETVTPWMLGGLIGGFILALIIIFRHTTAPYLAEEAEPLVQAGLDAVVTGSGIVPWYYRILARQRRPHRRTRGSA